MAYEIKFTEEAESEFESIVNYYLKNSSAETTTKAYSTIYNLILEISQSPKSYPIEKHNFRRALVSVFPYKIYFVEDDRKNEILIYAIAHVRREPFYWMK